ncbi:MAG: flagellar hook-length control protein FliK [Neptuniibacter sp.]
MSQQLSIPTGNGLLSLNLSALPQSVSTPAGGGNQFFTGFSSMMSNVAAEGDVPSGAFLPPQGISLPQGVADQVSLDSEQMKQRLLNLADMLGQQAGSGTDGEGLPAEVMAELAKALRNFAEGEITELPEELKQRLAESGAVTQELLPQEEGVELAEQQLAAEGSELALELEDVSEEVPVEQLADTEVSDEQADIEVSGSQPSEEVSAGDEVDSLVQVTAAASEESEESESSETEGQNAQQVNLSEEVVLEDGEASQEDTQVQLNAEAETDQADVEVSEEVVVQTNDPRRSPVAEAARQEFNADLYRNKGAYVSQVAHDVNKPGNAGVTPPPVNPVIADDADAPAVARVVPQGNTEAKPVEVQPQANVPKAEPQLAVSSTQTESIHKPADNQQLKAAAGNFSLDKFESMLEASQKLMTKAAAGAEKLGDSPFAQRLESATSSTNAVPQSVSQPTQVQKAVAEANNLMMPQNVKLNTPAWSNALAERAVMVAAQSTNVAQIQLDPPELGSLNIRVQINQDQVSLNFTSPHAHVRDAVEQSLPRLREMFAEQGLALTDSSVSDQQKGDSAKEEMAGDGRGSNGGYLGQAAEGDAQEAGAAASSVSLIDYYA